MFWFFVTQVQVLKYCKEFVVVLSNTIKCPTKNGDDEYSTMLSEVEVRTLDGSSVHTRYKICVSHN